MYIESSSSLNLSLMTFSRILQLQLQLSSKALLPGNYQDLCVFVPLHRCIYTVLVMDTEDTKPTPDITPPEVSPEEPVQDDDLSEVKEGATMTTFRSTNPVNGPDIIIGESGLSAEKPITIGEMMKQTVSKIPDHIGLQFKTGNNWSNVTFQEYYDMSVAAAKSFLKVC